MIKLTLQKKIKNLAREIAKIEIKKLRIPREEANFFRLVQLKIKNFDTIITSKNWQKYLKNKKIVTALSEAHFNRDLKTIKQIFSTYRKLYHDK